MKTYLMIRTESDNLMSSSLIENLVVQAKNKDAEAFGELYSYYAKDMFRFALYYTGQAYLAEDAVSEAVLNAFQNIEKLQKTGSFKAWLFSILFNCCKKAQKEKALALQRVELSAASGLSQEAFEKSGKADVQSLLSVLEEDEREILLLSFIGGYSSEEIGKMLSMKAVSVRSKKARSVKKLRKTML